jgi:hypothetical protein
MTEIERVAAIAERTEATGFGVARNEAEHPLLGTSGP